MTINRNHDDASSSDGERMRITTSNNDDIDVGSWSDLTPDVLLLVMMQLGVVDFVAFSGVCKLWRLKALPNRKSFMASKPPMLMCISAFGNNDKECCLEDYEGRKFKTILPHSVGRSCVGLTCGYLIMFMLKTRDFWLVNPITRHELHFPPAPCVFYGRHVLVFSPSISRYVFLMLDIFKNHIWYCIAGEGVWILVSSTHHFHNLHVFKGKIYTTSPGRLFWKVRCLYELKLNPEPKLTLLKTKNFLNEDLYLTELVSSGENLYLIKSLSVGGLYKVHKLDFGKMEWVQFEDSTRDEHAFFLSDLKYGAIVKSDFWPDPGSQHRGFTRNGRFFTANQWYFPHECLNVNLLDES